MTAHRSTSVSPNLHLAPAAAAVASEGSRAVEEGLSTYLPDLARRARQLTGDVSRADDLVQDTVERALRFRESYRAGGYLRAWLFRIMQNVFISQRRRVSTERRVLEGAGVDPNGWATLRPARQVPGLSPPVVRALQQMPDHLRSAVQLVDLGDNSYKDAAAQQEVPVGTIMSRLHRGRARLAAALVEPQAA
jgi:RNA polymerase sigma-70 factor (ECF subfamily)